MQLLSDLETGNGLLSKLYLRKK